MIRLDDIVVAFDERRVLDGIALEASAGETVALLGPSGSGKSTLLRVVAGLQRPDAGRVELDGTDVTRVPAHRRGVGLVFQDAVLFPHKTVGENVGFGLRVAGAGRDEERQRVSELLELVGLPGTEQRAAGTLSGGEAQRVALARALAPAPRVLLLDEPLASLDGPLRDRLRDDLRDLFSVLNLTAIHVTHDVDEAFALGHRVALLHAGHIAQIGSPEELWARPADEWVARFLGMRNVVGANGRRQVIRAEAVRLVPGDDAVVTSVDRRGPFTIVVVRRDTGEELESATTSLAPPSAGERVGVAIDPAGIVEIAEPAPSPDRGQGRGSG